MTADEPSPPPGLPDDVVDRLRALDDSALRDTIGFIRELLAEHSHHELEQEIEGIPEEELVSVTEHEGYFEVVRRRRCADGCPDCPHGPYLYHVKTVTNPDGTDTLRWELIGPVEEA